MARHRVEHRNDGNLVYVAIDPNGVRADADFVHPLIAVDFDTNGTLIGFSASGPAIDAALEIHKDLWRTPEKLVDALRQAHELMPA